MRGFVFLNIMKNQHICLAFTGASGFSYGLCLLENLLQSDCRVSLVYSDAASIVAKEEADFVLPNNPLDAAKMLQDHFGVSSEQLRVYAKNDWFAPIASGSNAPDQMVVCPCSMGTLAAIAHGLSDSLIERAADVAIKENKKLILVPRETPLSAIHLENMLKLAKLGVCILPPAPGFYQKPQTMDDLIHFVVARILNQLNVQQSLVAPWSDDK